MRIKKFERCKCSSDMLDFNLHPFLYKTISCVPDLDLFVNAAHRTIEKECLVPIKGSQRAAYGPVKDFYCDSCSFFCQIKTTVTKYDGKTRYVFPYFIREVGRLEFIPEGNKRNCIMLGS